MGDRTLEISFFHPHTDSTFRAEVDTQATAQTCVDELVRHAFIDAPARGVCYRLRLRGEHTMAADCTLASVGAVDHDYVLIVERTSGS